jgi:hypothetical protein
MSYRRNAGAGATRNGEQPVVVTLCEGRLALWTCGGCAGVLYQGFTQERLRYDILRVSVLRAYLTRHVGCLQDVYYVIRDLDPDDRQELPELFVASKPKVALPLTDEEDFACRLEQARQELSKIKKRLCGEHAAAGPHGHSQEESMRACSHQKRSRP